jgi:6,7-dimethyl-8-ribityllumazine synthase
MSQNSFEYQPVDAKELRFGIVAASYNPRQTTDLLNRTLQCLRENGVLEHNLVETRVPGSFEIPVVANEMALSGDFHALIALGVVIAGDTSHHEVIGTTTAQSLLQISTQTRTPVINGILVVNTQEQAEDRITGKQNRGPEFAKAALHMARLKQCWNHS